MLLALMLSLWGLVIAGNVYVDRNGKKPNYALVFCVRGGLAVVHGVFVDVTCHIFPSEWSAYGLMETFLIFLPLFLFQSTSFWILFELSLNVVRGRELFYFDRREHDSGWIDRLFDKLGAGAHLAAKLICLLLCVLSVMKLYQMAT